MNRCMSGSLLLLTTVLILSTGAAIAEEVRVSNGEQKSWSIEIAPAIRATTSRVAEQSADYFDGPVLAQQQEPAAPQLPEVDPASPDPFRPQPPQAQQPRPAQIPETEVAEPAPADPNLPVIVPQPVRTPSYMDVYQSIPFLRAEYEANPSYRHEATMELLFGQLRPMTIYKYQPMMPLRAFPYVTPYWYGYDGYRVNYNFFYPRPTVYRHY